MNLDLPVRPVDDTRVVMHRVGALMWISAFAIVLPYTLLFEGLRLETGILLALSGAGALQAAALPWARLPKYWNLPPLWAAVGMIVMAALVYDQPMMVMFLFYVLTFITAFYWDDRPLVVSHLFVGIVIYAGLPLAVAADEHSSIVLLSLPIFVVSVLLVGYLGSRLQGTLVDRARFEATIEALSNALHARDGYTGSHSVSTLELVAPVCAVLNLDATERAHVADVALLHDLGKIGIPNEILHKPGPLDAMEWKIMREHPLIGERIVRQVPGFEAVANAIRHEHERWDGTGYPDGIAGNDIPLASRIVFVCDAFQAMTSDRPYRGAMSHDEACEEMRRHAGAQFDPIVTDALLQVFAAERRDDREEHDVGVRAVVEMIGFHS